MAVIVETTTVVAVEETAAKLVKVWRTMNCSYHVKHGC